MDTKNLKTFATILISMLVLDGIWLGVIRKTYFTNVIDRMNPTTELKTNLKHPIWSFIIVYLLMSFALYYFVINNASKSKLKTILEAILLGATIYGVFDMTLLNLSGGWGIKDAFMDIAWGTFVFGIVTIITLYFMPTFN